MKRMTNGKVKMSKILLMMLVLVFVAGIVAVGFAEEATQIVTAKDWSKTKEYTVEIDKGGHLFWCGNKEIAVLRHESRDVSVITFYKDDLTDSKEETVSFAIFYYADPICSDDGRHVFFAEVIKKKRTADFVYYDYDRNAKKTKEIFSYKKQLQGIIIDKLISPKRKYFITPSSSTQITLPGIGTLKGVSLDAILEKDNSSRFILAWELSDRKLYLLNKDMQTLSIIDLHTLHRDNIDIKIENYLVSDIKATTDPNKVLLFCINEEENTKNVYLLDLKNRKKRITLLVKSIDAWEESLSGMSVYAKTYGAKLVWNGERYDPDPTKRYVSVNIVDNNYSKKNIKKIYFGKTINSLRALYDVPKISPDGNAVAFISKSDLDKNMKIYVIQRIK